jgi:hypothetical protein
MSLIENAALNFSAKDPGETIKLTVGFASLLAPNETIQSATWTIERQGTTEDTATMLQGNAAVEGTDVSQWVKGGVHGGLYLHLARITTSAGRILVQGVRQSVRKGA